MSPEEMAGEISRLRGELQAEVDTLRRNTVLSSVGLVFLILMAVSWVHESAKSRPTPVFGGASTEDVAAVERVARQEAQSARYRASDAAENVRRLESRVRDLEREVRDLQRQRRKR